MIVTRISFFDGKRRSVDLPITEEQYLAWDSGKCAQDAFPDLTLDQREFIITGCTPKCWSDGVNKDRLPAFKDLVFEQDLNYPSEKLGERTRFMARWTTGGITLSVAYGGSNYGNGPDDDQYEVAVYTGSIEDGTNKFIPLQEHDDVMGWASADYITQLLQIITRSPEDIFTGKLKDNACFQRS